MRPFTPRELSILKLLWDGLEVKEVAEALSLSPCTVKNYTNLLYAKCDVENRMQLMRKCLKAGILEP